MVRYITNKPKLNTTEANFTGGYATTAHGADSNSIEGVLNLPIIEDKFAIRGVVYNEDARRLYRIHSAHFHPRTRPIWGGLSVRSRPGRQRSRPTARAQQFQYRQQRHQ